MSLDMYVRVDAETVNEICYWRKHNALHSWFCNKAIKLGLVSSPNDFNCVNVPITQELLNELVEAIKQGKLEPTGGFFFGNTEYDPKELMAEGLEQCQRIQKELDKGNEPYYSSWW